MSSEERLLAALCHIGPLIGLPVLIPLIIYLLKKDSPFVRRHAKEAIAFQLGVLIIAFISILLFIVLIGILLFFAVLLYALIMTVVAVIKAADGKEFRFPLTTQFAQKF